MATRCHVTLNPELIVLTGLHEGARVALPASTCVVGSAEGCDVVLVDPGVQPIHASLGLAGQSAVLRLSAAAGQQEAAAEECLLAPYEPFLIGTVWLVLVPVAFAWGEVLALPDGGAGHASGQAKEDRPEGTVRARSPVQVLLHRRWPLALAVAAAMTATVGVVAGNGQQRSMLKPEPASARTLVAPSQDEALRRIVDDLALRSVKIDTTVEPPVLAGFVANPEELQALARALAAQTKPGRTLVRVQVGTELAQRAQEFLGDPGVRASYVSPGKLVLSGRAATRQAVALNRRVQQLSEDLGVAVALDDRIDYGDLRAQVPPPKDEPLPLRIVEVQADEPAFFRTADGGKFFVGARMPDGAEVVAVGAEQITFRKNGRSLAYRVLE